jgi:hypothetical protein
LAVSVAADGYVPVLGHNLAVDADGGDLGVIVLEPAVKAVGFVIDGAGPVPDALVEALVGFRFHRLPDDGEEDYDEAYQRRTTDAGGGFELDGIPSLPASGSLLVTHSDRGRSYLERAQWTEQPLQVTLVPDVSVSFELIDAQTHVPVEAEVTLEPKVPDGEFLLVSQAKGYGFGRTPPKSARSQGGRLDVRMPYYLVSLTLRVGDYDASVVPMTTMASDADHRIELELTRPARLLVRVRAAGSGELIENARLGVSQVFDPPRDRMLNHNFLLMKVRFDAEAGGYVVAESDLGIATSKEVSLWAQLDGFANSRAAAVASHGQRTCADSIDLYLEPE